MQKLPKFAFSSLKTRKTSQLKHLLTSKSLDFIMEAHNGLSAAIVQESGFKGLKPFNFLNKFVIFLKESGEVAYQFLHN